MSENVISVRELGKRFRLKHGTPRRTLREDLLALPHQLANLYGGKLDDREDFWALRDVSFDVKAGEVVGIIGRNGAGKSTLLKILSRVLEPTSGEALVSGRIGSLLEVGTGFHPELTGRENVFLSGALLGMKRPEIRSRFDEIVAFAGVEKFLDTPCKHYSSGMFARLGFAVAAYLDAEIVLVDEVLAVGDFEFQQRCVKRMDYISSSGRAILLVSHDMTVVRNLCQRVAWLDSGTVRKTGTADEVLPAYFAERSILDRRSESNIATVQMIDGIGTAKDYFSLGDSVSVQISLDIPPSWTHSSIRIAVELSTSEGLPIANMIDADSGFGLDAHPGKYLIRVHMDDIRLYPGDYRVGFWAGSSDSREVLTHLENAADFRIVDGGRLTSRYLPRSRGLIFFTPRWECRQHIQNA